MGKKLPYEIRDSNVIDKIKLYKSGVIVSFILSAIFIAFFDSSFTIYYINHFTNYEFKPENFISSFPGYYAFAFKPFHGFYYQSILWYYLIKSPVLNKYILMFAIFPAVLSLAVIFYLYSKFNKYNSIVDQSHGSASFAEDYEIGGYGFFGREGVVIGGYTKGNNVVKLMHNGPEHVLVFAPTRSGKGVGLIIPTLLTWKESVIIYDIKGENFNLTSGYRKSALGNKVLKFEPGSVNSIHFNPLDEIRIKTQSEVSDTQNLAYIIVNDGTDNPANEHWMSTARSLLVGTILHVLYSNEIKEKSLRTVRRFLTNNANAFIEMFQYIHDPDFENPEKSRRWLDINGKPTGTHPVVASSASEMMARPEQESGSVLSTALRFLSLYEDEVVGNNTADSTFKIKDLMNYEKPISLYLVVSPNDQDRMVPLIRLLWDLFIRKLTAIMEFENGELKKSYKHKMLLLIDEFPTLGKVEILEKGLAFMAGYGIKGYFITQDLMQLKKVYGNNESIVSNSHIRLAYAPNNYETAKLLSDTLGATTIKVPKESRTVSGGKFLSANSQTTTSYQVEDKQRALLTPDEVMRLEGPVKNSTGDIISPGAILILVSGKKPIMGTQSLYFFDPELKDRVKIAPAFDKTL